MDTYQNLLLVSRGLTKKFPNGNEPFQIITRICEEAGEVAKEVNHFENTGIKREKYGEPSKDSLAGEIKNLITATLTLVDYYEIHEELDASVKKSLGRLKEMGFLTD
jgi:NTP pyrophosphatase (non-canonical NTP hydrolase)